MFDTIRSVTVEEPAAGVAVGVREHHLKTDGALAVAGDANGELAYTTHTGHTYFSWPEPWEEPPRVVDLALVLPERRKVAELGEPPF
jgi:hypothetical protein